MGMIVPWPLHARASEDCKPKTEGSASLPRSRNRLEKTKKYSGGMRLRAFQLAAVETDLAPTSSQAAAGPPTASTISETELSIPPVISHPVTMSSGNAQLLGKRADSAFNHGMASKSQVERMMADLQREEARRLDIAQKALKLRNQALAEKIGITQQAWSQYRTGERPLPKEALYMLHRDYGVTVQYLLFDDRRGINSDLSAYLLKRKVA